MRRTVIADTSCFIILTNIDKLDLLQKVYGQIVITPEIANEYGEPFPDWVKINTVSDTYRQKLLEMQLDKGESSAISLALEIPDSLVVLDDYKARKLASRLGIIHTGTIGIIIKAKLNGIMSSIKPVLEDIKKTNFRLSLDIEIQALNEAGE